MLKKEQLEDLIRACQTHRCAPVGCTVCRDRDCYQSLLTIETDPASAALSLILEAYRRKHRPPSGVQDPTSKVFNGLVDTIDFVLSLK